MEWIINVALFCFDYDWQAKILRIGRGGGQLTLVYSTSIIDIISAVPSLRIFSTCSFTANCEIESLSGHFLFLFTRARQSYVIPSSSRSTPSMISAVGGNHPADRTLFPFLPHWSEWRQSTLIWWPWPTRLFVINVALNWRHRYVPTPTPSSHLKVHFRSNENLK